LTQRIFGVGGGVLIAAALIVGCSNSTGIPPAAPIGNPLPITSGGGGGGGGGGGSPTPSASGSTATPGSPTGTPTGAATTPATPTATPTLPGGGTTPTPTAIPPPPTPAPPVVVTPAALTFTQPGQNQTFTASEAGYTGAFTATACQPAGIASVAPVANTTNQFTVTSQTGGQCTIGITDGVNTGNGATVSVSVNNNGIILQGKARR